MNLERTGVLLFYYFVYLKVNLDLEKTNPLDEPSPNFIFAAANLDPIVIEKKVNWWWILTYRFCWKRKQRWRLEVSRFKMPFDACINKTKSGPCSQTYSWIVIPLSRIRVINTNISITLLTDEIFDIFAEAHYIQKKKRKEKKKNRNKTKQNKTTNKTQKTQFPIRW